MSEESVPKSPRIIQITRQQEQSASLQGIEFGILSDDCPFPVHDAIEIDFKVFERGGWFLPRSQTKEARIEAGSQRDNLPSWLLLQESVTDGVDGNCSKKSSTIN